MAYKAQHDVLDIRVIVDKRLPDDFDQFRLFFISDIHRRIIKKSTLNSINDRVDAVIIGGDLLEKWVPLSRARKNIKRLKKWHVPVYFIWGNNDYDADPEGLTSMLSQEGVTILKDAHVDFTMSKSRLRIMGLSYYDQKLPEYQLPRTSIKSDYLIVTAHSPMAFEGLPGVDQNSIHTFLSGHTHGGQIRVFNYGPYERGGYEMDGNTHKLVSEGYGYRLIPFRLGTNAECHVITFKNR